MLTEWLHRTGRSMERESQKSIALMKQKGLPKWQAFVFGAPGRAHLLGGGSPLLARQGEELAERQGCSGRLEIWRKPKAKRWP
ncbi:MAG: hypothetical protein L6Q60_07790, partial [Rhodocyclaceae bacterium]|nr:hypothetical protein [Rhodocyclaceae bacterium]